jgi:SulP family sulfate permease
VALVASTILVGGAHLGSHGVAVLGTVAHGAPNFGLHEVTWTRIGELFPLAGVVALVVISQTAATSRAFADAGDYDVDMGRDFLGVGAGGILAGVSGTFPVNASPARTAAVATAGGRSQLSGLAAAVAVVLLVPAAAVLHDVPVATLGAILVFVASRIFHWRDLWAIRRFDLFELALAVVTLLTVAFVGVEQGIGVAVGLAILDRTRLSSRPTLHRLGRIPGTTSWAPLHGTEAAVEVPGMLVLLFATPLYYANVEHFRGQLTAMVRGAGSIHTVVLDVVGMHDIDFTGTRVLGRVLDELERRHIVFALARAGQHVVGNLERSGLLARIGPEHLYSSVDEAVTALAASG